MAILLPSTSALLPHSKADFFHKPIHVSHVWVAIIPVRKNNHLNVLENGNIHRHCMLTKARTSLEKNSNTAESVDDLSDKTNPDTKPQVRRTTAAAPPQPPPLPTRKQPQVKKPSVAEIERAIGAGIFRDRDINRESEQEKTLFDSILSNSIGRTEGDVEKKLRETGEWIIDKTEGGPSRSTGKNILKVVFLWILPLWIVSFLVASGVVKLPIISPVLDDLIM